MGAPPKISPLAPATFPELLAVGGVRFATAACGVKYTDRMDVLLGAFDTGTTVAGVLTQSKTASAPVGWCRKNLAGGQAQALLVNSGNANAFTGVKGLAAVEATVSAVADTLTCRPSRVFTASTGVIGEQLPAETITSAMAGLYDQLADADNPAVWQAAAEAIMTTDTFPKASMRKVKIGKSEVTLVGIAKGSGMIAPDMATMLAFVFTDAEIPHNILQSLLSNSVEKSFNSITVDSDTSTNDTVLLFATGQADHKIISDITDESLSNFSIALDSVMLDLAQQIVKDGEGATKFIEINVSDALNDVSARKIALSIANSPLVKTAIAGEDANWGRIVMAVGKSGERADRDKLSISIGGIEIATLGRAIENYNEKPVIEHMKGEEINIDVDVGIDEGAASVWTCDLTHGYITINADYRT